MTKPLNKFDSPNATIEIYDEYVKKVMKKKSNTEKRERFKLECEVLQSLSKTDLQIVKVHDIQLGNKPYHYTMEKCDGDSNDLLREM